MLILSPSRAFGAAYSPTIVAPVAPAFGRAFDAACHHEGLYPERRLFEATRALVERLKSDGLPPERVLVALKAALTKYAGLHRPPTLDLESSDCDAEELTIHYRHVFAWFLETYFA